MYLMTLFPLSRERLSSLVGVGSVVTGGQMNRLASGWKLTSAASVVGVVVKTRALRKKPPNHFIFVLWRCSISYSLYLLLNFLMEWLINE
mmetsp:Transcript_4516/g.9367  ORF Transcript_4516/g.9367 Transcript_4516/m.9367 type:complete len:90 (-) Transcript_4516:49-318(-)